jgi:hypothetical protein
LTVETWLLERVGDAPRALVETMVGAVRATSFPSPWIPDGLSDAALALFRQVAEGSGDREDALPLLAADALLTHAFEAQAEIDPEGLPEFVNRQARAERLAALSI